MSSELSTEALQALMKSDAINEAWRLAQAVEALCDPEQRQWVHEFQNLPPGTAAAWLIARQRGKSWAAMTMACDFAAGTPNRIIRYAALTGKSAAAVVVVTIKLLLETCPEELKPEIDEHAGTITWKNGSVLTWAGTDNEQFDRLRGPFAHLILLDECGFYDNLERVEAALLPQLTTTGGKVLYLTTPPESVGHEFVARWRASQARGTGKHSTIHDSPRLGPSGLDGLMRFHADRLGLTIEQLIQSTFWRREYLAELVTDSQRAAIPAWTSERHKLAVMVRQRPLYFDAYESLDTGKIGDPHAALFGFLDYERRTLHIEDELELISQNHTVAALATEVKLKERALWGASSWEGKLLGAPEWRKEFGDLPPYLKTDIEKNAPRQPWLRSGDDDHLVLNTLCTEHGLAIVATKKDDKHLAVDAVNELFVQGRITIDPRCVRLLEQLYTTIWTKNRSRWERTLKDHGDLIDCLVYLVRNINWHRDPRPIVIVDTLRGIHGPPPNRGLDAMKGMFR